MPKRGLAIAYVDGGPNDLFGAWALLSPDTTDEEARATFYRWFGRVPERIIREGDELLVGPIEPGEESD